MSPAANTPSQAFMYCGEKIYSVGCVIFSITRACHAKARVSEHFFNGSLQLRITFFHDMEFF